MHCKLASGHIINQCRHHIRPVEVPTHRDHLRSSQTPPRPNPLSTLRHQPVARLSVLPLPWKVSRSLLAESSYKNGLQALTRWYQNSDGDGVNYILNNFSHTTLKYHPSLEQFTIDNNCSYVWANFCYFYSSCLWGLVQPVWHALKFCRDKEVKDECPSRS